MPHNGLSPAAPLAVAKTFIQAKQATPIDWPTLRRKADWKEIALKREGGQGNHISGIDEKKRFNVEMKKTENDTVEIKNSFATQKMEVAPLPLPDPGLLRLSGSRSQIAWLNSRVELTLFDIYIPIEVFLFLKF